MLQILLNAFTIQNPISPMGASSFEVLERTAPNRNEISCWLVKCMVANSTVAPPIRAKVYEINSVKKERKLLGEQEVFDAPVVEELHYKEQPYRFLFLQSSASTSPFMDSVQIPRLIVGANYLVWSTKFDGTSPKGSLLEMAEMDYIFNMPAWMRSAKCRMATGRVRTVSIIQPKNLKEKIEGVLGAIALGGADAEFEVEMLQSASATDSDSRDFIYNELPKEAMRLRSQTSSIATKTIYSYLASYFGGPEYTQEWLDDLVQISFDAKTLAEDPGIKSISPNKLIDFANGKNFQYPSRSSSSIPVRFSESNSQAMERFRKSKDDEVKRILIHILQDPKDQKEIEKWVPIFVHSTGDTWEKELASKLASWLNSPKLSPYGGPTLDGLRQRYREIYGID